MRPGRVAVLAVSSAVLAACAPGPSAAGPVSSQPAAVTGIAQDVGVRTVRMNSGRALTYVLPETAAQILCQILEKDRWEQVLADRVGRQPSPAECLVSGERIGLSLRLSGGDEAFSGQTTVGGRPAVALRGDDEVRYRVALTDDALRPVRNRIARPLLDLAVTYGTGLAASARRELAVRVLSEVVPLLADVGDQLPDVDEQGRVGYVRAPLTRGGQIVDLPRPVQALQLCTLLLERQGVQATGVVAADDGRCSAATAAGPVALALVPAGAGATAADRIAGRPAHAGSPGLLVRLRDDAPVELSVSAPDSPGLAEALVPALLG